MIKPKSIPNTLYIGPKTDHPVHIGFAESIYAKFYSYDASMHFMSRLCMGMKLPNYDVYLLDAPAKLILKKITTNCKLIQLTASLFYPHLTLGVPKIVPKWERVAKKHLYRCLYRTVDGAIAVSEFIKNEASKILKCPIKVVHPYIQPALYTRLSCLKPNLDTHKISFIGYHRENIRCDILIEAFKLVKEEFRDSELYIIGKGHSKELERFGGIHVTGWVDDIVPFLQKTSLLVFPGYGQAFYIGVTEALRAGVPALISKYTGAKDVVKEIKREFIRNITPEDFAKGIAWYFDLSLDEKKQYSKRARAVSEGFTKKRKCQEFREKFESLLEEIG